MEAERDQMIRRIEAAAGAKYSTIQDTRTAALAGLEETLRRGPAMRALEDLQALSAVLRDAGSRVKELAEMYTRIPSGVGPGGRPTGLPDWSQFRPPELNTTALSAVLGAAATQGTYQALVRNAVASAGLYQNLLAPGSDATPEAVAAARVAALESAAALDKFVESVTRTGRAAARLITEPLQVSADAQRLVAQLNREMEKGTNAVDTFLYHWSLLNEALAGPFKTPELDAVFGGALGAAWFGNMRPPGAITDQFTRDFGLFQEYEKFQKTLPNFETSRPTAAMAGSREAYEILARANMQQPDVQERIRAEVAMGNYIANAQWQEQQRTTRALESLQQQGVVIPKAMKR
jgi:hypothetical protein